MTYDIRLDGSESTGPEGIYLVWYRDWCLNVDECESLEEALVGYKSILHGYDSPPECIEGPGGLVPEADIHAWIVAEDARQQAKVRTDSLDGRVRFTVELRPLDSNEGAEFSAFDDLSDAVVELGRINKPGRARVVAKVFQDRRWVTERVVIDWAGAEGQAAA